MICFQKSLIRVACLVLATGSVLAGCKKDEGIIGPDGSPSDVIFPTTNISYSQHVQRLFSQTCMYVGCHSQAEPADQLKLDTYENLRYGVRGLPVVIPGSPETSELVFRIEGRTGQRMPPNTTNPLNQNQINGIRTWIAEGALKN
ncbi:hypothetical protein FBQ87_07760 [Sphingobacteriales bacterium CHB3]|nr:hypothetical protein [Sphingobacteriales bacterium CHB3]